MDDIGKTVGDMSRAVGIIIWLFLILLPFAIWQIGELIYWLFTNVTITVG